MLTGDGGGAVRYYLGYPTAGSGLGNPTDGRVDSQVRYDWLGTLQHEVGHLVSGQPDFYGWVWEDYNAWNILSVGNALGQFPAPTSAYFRRMTNYGRVEQRLEKGESVRITPPNPSRDAPREMLVLDNSTVGSADELVVEYRNHDPADARPEMAARYDTGGTGLPNPNPDGLLFEQFDRSARGNFFSVQNVYGGRPDAFTHAAEDTAINQYPLAPVTLLKRKSGARTDSNTLYGEGDELVGSHPEASMLQYLNSSANADGDVLWEFRNLRQESNATGQATGFSFDAQFMGRPFAADAVAAVARWTSASGPMTRAFPPTVPENGAFFDQTNFRSLDGRHYLSTFWIQPNRHAQGSPAYWAEGTFPHTVDDRGDHLAGRIVLAGPASQVPRGSVDVRLDLVDGASVTTLVDVRVRDSSPEFSADLTPWHGRTVTLRLRIESADTTGVGIVGGYYYRKAGAVLYDFVRHAPALGARSPWIDPIRAVSEDAGAAGTVGPVRMVDGVTYDTGLFMKPRSVANGQMTLASPFIPIPASGAVLRGSAGFPDEPCDPTGPS